MQDRYQVQGQSKSGGWYSVKRYPDTSIAISETRAALLGRIPKARILDRQTGDVVVSDVMKHYISGIVADAVFEALEKFRNDVEFKELELWKLLDFLETR